MDENPASLLGKDTAWNGMIADAKHARLLDRVNFSIPKEETILHIGIAHERMPTSFVMTIVLGLIFSIEATILTPIALLAGIAMTGGLLLIWRIFRARLLRYLHFTILVFTDKALYQAFTSPAAVKNLFGCSINRIEYHVIKAVCIHLNPLRDIQCKLSASILTEYAARKYATPSFNFAASPANFKRIVESIMHDGSVASVQKDHYAKRAGSSAATTENSYDVRKDMVASIHGQRVQDCASMLLWIAIFLVITALEIFTHGVPATIVPAIIIAGIIGYIVLAFLITKTLVSLHQLAGFYLKGDTYIEVRADGIGYTTGIGAKFFPFSEGFVATPIVQESRSGHVKAYSVDSEHGTRIKLGPVNDVWGLYFDIREKYEKWLETRRYFIDSESLIKSSIKDNGYMATFEKHLLREGSMLEPRELKIAKKPKLDALEQLKQIAIPDPKRLRDFAPGLLIPDLYYLDLVNDDELFYLVMHLARPLLKPLEIVVTSDQLIVGDPVLKIVTRISYTRIRYAEVKIRASSSRFVAITLYLEPAEIPIVLNPRSAKRTREVVPPSHEFVLPKLVLKKISRDSPFIAVLAGKGNVQFMLK